VRRIAFMVAAISFPAAAQQTTCTTFGNTTNCNTQQNTGPDWKLLQQSQINPLAAYQTGQRAAAERQQNAARTEMTEIWARCRKRWNEALEKRDFELADALVKGCPAAP